MKQADASPSASRSAEHFLTNVLWSWTGVAANLALGILLSPYMIRKLGNEAYGLWALVFSLVEYFWVLDAGLRSAVVNFVARDLELNDRESIRSTMTTAFAVYSGVCVIALAGTALLAVWAPGWFQISAALQGSFRMLVLLTGSAWALSCLALPWRAALEAHQMFPVVNRIWIGSQLFRVGGSFSVIAAGYGLEALDVHLTPRGTVQVDPFLRTNYPSILAAGDVAGRYQFTHAAANMAWYAAVNALFGGFWQFRIDERVMPWCTFLDPEVARVGLNEQDADEQGIAVEVTRYSLDDLDRAIVDGATRGFVKVLTRPGTDRILGATIVGEHAGELIVEFVTAMKRGLGLNKLLGTIHIYPTFAEANKYAAGQWKRAHAPTRMLGWVERFHRWQRG